MRMGTLLSRRNRRHTSKPSIAGSMYYEIGALITGERESGLVVSGGNGAIAFAFKVVLDGGSERRFVVDDQDCLHSF